MNSEATIRKTHCTENPGKTRGVTVKCAVLKTSGMLLDKKNLREDSSRNVDKNNLGLISDPHS